MRLWSFFVVFFVFFLFSNAVAVPVQQSKPVLFFIYSERCPACATVKPIVEQIEEKYADRLSVEWIEITKEPQRAVEIQKSYGIPMDKWGVIPKAFFKDYYCTGAIACNDLEKEVSLRLLANSNGQTPVFHSELGFFNIALLALIDSINPCSLAVLVILLTAILLKFPEKKKKALVAGLSFSIAVFIAYFLTGALIIFGFKSALSVTHLDTLWIYRVIALLAVVLGLIEVRNFFRDPKTCPVINLPEKWKPYWNNLVEGTLSAKGALIIGLFVSVFLLPCSAGPYLIAGGILAGVSWTNALPWLVFYNSIFIIPMVFVTLLVYGGLSAVENVDEWQHKNMKYVHLVAGIVLVLLGIAMFFGLL